MSNIVAEYVQADGFQELLKGDIPLVVDCTASWCGPCKLVAPLMDRLAASHEGKASVVKLDIDENQAIAREYGIRSIPAVLLFKNGELIESIVGVSPYERFNEALEALI
ncbi:MAG: thioredoxin [Cyanobacteria bacterium P01_F01_bin.150]